VGRHRIKVLAGAAPAAWLATTLREAPVAVRSNYVGPPSMAGRCSVRKQGGVSRRISGGATRFPRPEARTRGQKSPPVERRWARAFSALFANDVVTHAARAERLRTPFGSGADTLTVRLTALRSLGMRERKKRQAHPSPDKTPADDAWLFDN